jgi:hypothetical protein
MRLSPLAFALPALASLAVAAACGGGSGNGKTGTSNSGGGGHTSSSTGDSTSSSGSGGSSSTSGNTSSHASTGSGMLVMPGDPGAHDVLFAVDSTMNAHPISPYIYGTNQGDLSAEAKNLTMTRVGGNRLTAYNWETNASNAGSDYLYENDDFMSASKVAGDPMKQAVTDATSHAASIIMTVPIAGWVSADENGPCPSNPTQAQIAQRFLPILPKKGSAFAYPPSTTDGKVYADEFVSYLESQFPSAQTDPQRRIFYMLDNEPDLWSATHSEIHPAQLTYAEIVQKNTDFAKGIKGVAPKSIVFGPVNYGWAGYQNLQGAPDANNRDFLDFYLDSMKAAEGTAGERLVDVLDVHWYPEATGDGHRIVDDGITAGEVDARLQAPRSLWDSTYTETSWITDCCSNGPIALIPRLLQKIKDHYPGTKLSLSEYNYGAGGDISGGLAEADALGVFGREGLFAAATWLMTMDSSYLFGGFALYRNYDGNGGAFGDTSIDLANSDIDKTSAYASVISSDGANVIVVAINKTTGALVAGITLKHTALSGADVYVLTSAGSTPKKGMSITPVAANAFSYQMPPHSATTLVFHP